MKVYVNWFKSYSWYRFTAYVSLSEALRKHGTANLYTINLKKNEYLCQTSLYQYWYSEKWKELVYWENKDKDNDYYFIFKEWENPLYFWVEERDKRTKDFVKRLSKFDKKDKAKQDLIKQIEELQQQLKDLEKN